MNKRIKKYIISLLVSFIVISILFQILLGFNIIFISLITGLAIATLYINYKESIWKELPVAFIGAFLGVILALHANGIYENKKEIENFHRLVTIMNIEMGDMIGTTKKMIDDINSGLLPTVHLSSPTLQDSTATFALYKYGKLKDLILIILARKDIDNINSSLSLMKINLNIFRNERNKAALLDNLKKLQKTLIKIQNNTQEQSKKLKGELSQKDLDELKDFGVTIHFK